MFSVVVDAVDWRQRINWAIRKGLPDVVARTLNVTAASAQMQAVVNLRKDFTLRNQYTEQGLFIASPSAATIGGRIWPAKGTNIARMNAVAGSKTSYMELQEEGGTARAKGKSFAMPTITGRGGDEKKLIPKVYRLRAMGQIKGARQRYTKGGRSVRGKGFFILSPGPVLRQPAIFYRDPREKGARLVKIRLLGKRSQRIKPMHFFRAAVLSTATYAKMNATFDNVAKLNSEMKKLL